jgi:proteasome lid subunit RPN8/RPN11
MFKLNADHFTSIVAHLIKELPNEGCGILIGNFVGSYPYELAETKVFFPTPNEKNSALAYQIPAKSLLEADRLAEKENLEIIGVVHSHTNSDPYPSSTDVQNAFDPSWYYIIVSFRFEHPSLRAYRINNGIISEEAVVVEK